MRFLFFEIWSILYSTVVKNELGTYQAFSEPDSDANQGCWGLNPKVIGVGYGSAGGGVRGEVPIKTAVLEERSSQHKNVLRIRLSQNIAEKKMHSPIFSECITKVKYKINHNSKTKNRTKKLKD